MSIFDDLLTLKGLITISVGTLISIRTARVSISSTRITGSVIVNGNGNFVVNYNNSLDHERDSYDAYWKIAGVLFIAAYIYLGEFVNGIIGPISVFGPVLAVFGAWLMLKRLSWAGLQGTFFVIPAVIAVHFVDASAPYLPVTAKLASGIPDGIVQGFRTIGTHPTYFGGVLPYLKSIGQILEPVFYGMIRVLGITTLLFSSLHAGLCFLEHRNPNNALSVTVSHTVVALIGFYLAVGFYEAAMYGDLQYLIDVTKRAFPFF
ncbi:hypothetical protein ABNQ39_13220 [Azospirillum sp. A26]|uniref:hypothetical protein n=1 Tax=Azospirillum sp. A26 TaxID=3160607 RepID=UPI0036724A72